MSLGMPQRFVRTTHDHNEMRVYNGAAQHAWQECGFVVHMLESDKPCTFEELCDGVWKYNNDFGEVLMDKSSIAYQLVIALEHGFAGVCR